MSKRNVFVPQGWVSTAVAASTLIEVVGMTYPNTAAPPGMSAEAEAWIKGCNGQCFPHSIKDLWRHLHDTKTTQYSI